MRARIDPEGNLQFLELDPICAETLKQLPELLRVEDAEVRDRLLPDTYDDYESAEQWRRYAQPELEHLFASRAELVAKDLEMLGSDDEDGFSLIIPSEHRAAWLSALNAARITMFITSGLEAKELEADPGTLGDYERDLMVARIDALAFVQQLMLEARTAFDGTGDAGDDDDVDDELDDDWDPTAD